MTIILNDSQIKDNRNLQNEVVNSIFANSGKGYFADLGFELVSQSESALRGICVTKATDLAMFNGKLANPSRISNEFTKSIKPVSKTQYHLLKLRGYKEINN